LDKYFGHKPQWRRGTTPRPAPVLEMKRDIRSGDFKFEGPVYQPDPRSSPGRVPSVPRKAHRSWGSPVNFNPQPGYNQAAKRAFYRNLGRGVGGLFRGAQVAMDVWDMYDDVKHMLGGGPYSIDTTAPVGGGPSDWSYSSAPNPIDGGHTVFPSPDGLPGWTRTVQSRWFQGFRGFGSLGSSDRFLRFYEGPQGFWHGVPLNANGSYSPAQIDAIPIPTYAAGPGSSSTWRVQNRLQDGGWYANPPPEWGSVRPAAVTLTKIIPAGGTAPVIGTFPRPFNVPDLDPESIAEGWPREGSKLNTLMPWEAWPPGVAWWRIPGRSRLRAIDPRIRTETNGPPLHPNKPGGVIHKPPGPGVTESKRRTNSAALLWWYRAAKKAWHETGEYCDRIDAIYEALPKDARLKYRPGKAISCADKTAVLLRNLHRIDMNEAIKNLVVNEIEDRIIGAGFRSLDEAARKLGIPGWRVDLGMQGNVESAIEFLFEIKKALTP